MCPACFLSRCNVLCLYLFWLYCEGVLPLCCVSCFFCLFHCNALQPVSRRMLNKVPLTSFSVRARIEALKALLFPEHIWGIGQQPRCDTHTKTDPVCLSRCRRFLQVPELWAARPLVPDRGVPAFLPGPRPLGHTPPGALAVRSGKHGADPWGSAPALHLPALLVPAVLPHIQDGSACHEVRSRRETLTVCLSCPLAKMVANMAWHQIDWSNSGIRTCLS